MYPVNPRKINKRYKNFSNESISREISEEAKLNGIDISTNDVAAMIVSFNQYIINQMKTGKSFCIAHLGKFIPTKKNLELQEKQKIKDDIYKQKAYKINLLNSNVYLTRIKQEESYQKFNNRRIAKGEDPISIADYNQMTNFKSRMDRLIKRRRILRSELKKLK